MTDRKNKQRQQEKNQKMECTFAHLRKTLFDSFCGRLSSIRTCGALMGRPNSRNLPKGSSPVQVFFFRFSFSYCFFYWFSLVSFTFVSFPKMFKNSKTFLFSQIQEMFMFKKTIGNFNICSCFQKMFGIFLKRFMFLKICR